MSKEKKKVCTPPATFCTALDERLEYANAARKGLIPILVFNERTETERLVGVAYKTVAKDRGHMLNLCPFCGESLEWWGPQSDTDEAAEGGERSGS